MVLKLEEAKWTLAQSTNELQAQNNDLMSKNMELRRQKHHMSLEVRALRSHQCNIKKLVNQALLEVDVQSASIKRQENCLVDLHLIVSQQNDRNSEIPGVANEEDVDCNGMIAPNILYEIKKSVKASCGGQVGLSPIVEETPTKKDGRRTVRVLSRSLVQEVDDEDMVCDPKAQPGQISQSTANFTAICEKSVRDINLLLREFKDDEEFICAKTVVDKMDGSACIPKEEPISSAAALASEFNEISAKESTIEGQSKMCRQVKVLDANRLIDEVIQPMADDSIPVHTDPGVIKLHTSASGETRTSPCTLEDSKACGNPGVDRIEQKIPDTFKLAAQHPADQNVTLLPRKDQISTSSLHQFVEPSRGASPISTDEVLETSCMTFVKDEATSAHIVEEESPPRRIMTRARSKPRKSKLQEPRTSKSQEAPNNATTEQKPKRTATRKVLADYHYGEISCDVSVSSAAKVKRKRAKK
ncbi:hypothetical protein GE061_001821 [Apolygus lucorum]|uniref:Uncharacterized protein n=1 Tax=Apolygus lucorum TaxID=248454 RepID=A0A6A4JJT9_APOLU|nr:hypothetical protein GE061_001821 [Apolygus lucorum]